MFLSEQQTLVVTTKSTLLICSAKCEKTVWTRHSNLFSQQSLTEYVDQVEV